MDSGLRTCPRTTTTSSSSSSTTAGSSSSSPHVPWSESTSSIYHRSLVQGHSALVEELNGEINELDEVLSTLAVLSSKVSAFVVVPLGPQAFFLGEVVHTNEVFMNVGDVYYAHRTVPRAVESLKERRRFFVGKKDTLEKELTNIRTKIRLLNDQKDLLEWDVTDGSVVLPHQPQGVVVVAGEPPVRVEGLTWTPEGFAEIREGYINNEKEETEKESSKYEKYISAGLQMVAKEIPTTSCTSPLIKEVSSSSSSPSVCPDRVVVGDIVERTDTSVSSRQYPTQSKKSLFKKKRDHQW